MRGHNACINMKEMKNLSKIMMMLSGIVFLNTSCKKWLAEENFTQIGSDVIYTTEEGLKVGLGALYNLQRAYERVTDANYGNLWLYSADDLGNVRTYNDAQIYRANMNAQAMPKEKWTSGYQLIDRSSAIITRSRDISFRNETEKNRLVAAAKVIRAMTYLKIWQLYDNILIDTIPTDNKNAFEPMVYKPAAKEDVLNLINFDLDFAIANLPYLAKPGQINQGLARHLRAQVAAWQGDWATMAAQTDEVINKGGFSLQPIDKVFAQEVNHKEAIYTYQFDEVLGGNDALSGGGSHALSALFTARYYEIPGGYMIEDNNWGGNTYAWTTPNDYLKSLFNPDPVTGKTPDKRYTSYFYPDTIISNNPKSPQYGLPIPKNKYPDNYRQYHWSVMKYRDFSKPDGRAASYKDVIAYRLAETYLLGAEAHWRLSGDPADPTALLYINKVRQRAGMPDLTILDQQTILDESARELNFEGGRWFLLKRMGVLVSQVNKYHTYGSARTNQVIMPMQPFQVRWPIPQDQIDLMAPTFPQNQGY